MIRLLVVIMGGMLLAGAHEATAQSASLPLSAFSTGFGRQTGSGERVYAQIGSPAVGRSSGSGKVILSGFLPGAMRLGGGTVDVPEEDPGTPHRFELLQNYPNPFNPSTTIRYGVAAAGRVTLRIFNLLGQEVKTLVDEEQEAGFRSVEWNGTNHASATVGSGVYFYELRAGASVRLKKMVLVK